MRAVEMNLATLEATVEQRLDAGAKTFDAQRKLLDEIRHDTAPKRVSYLSLSALMLTALLAGGGLVWALSTMLADRPNRSELGRRFDNVEAHVERTAATLRVEQAAQREELQSFRTQITRDLTEIKASVQLRPR